jgi:hypothetical protein
MPRRTAQSSKFPWSRYRDERLLDMRIADLGLTLEGSAVEWAVEQLYDELSRRALSFRPHAWLSNEWFTPDRVPGIAIPFSLAHPRLVELERSQMLEVEGGTPDWCMRILRHEAGHAIDNAYRLHQRKRYQELFGDYHAPYPDSYKPKPYTRSSSSTWTCGTPRRTPPRTSPRRSRSGCATRGGGATTPAGP